MTTPEVETLLILSEVRPHFSWHDYLFFMILLLLSAAIGIYFGFFKSKATTADEYLLGGKQMGVFEISFSLVSSTISGITVLALPSEVYRYGAVYVLAIFAVTIGLVTSYFCVMPVFTKLQTPSTFEYLKLRFNETLRSVTSVLFTIIMFVYLPVNIYLPALAVAQGTGFNIHYITPMICGVCIFYTTIGGLKAVVWTDALQFVVMVIATAVVVVVGTNSAGGFSVVWNRAYLGDRLAMDFDPNPTKRDTVWTNTFCMFFIWSAMATFHQGTVQKCLALPNMQKIKYSYILFVLGVAILYVSSVYIGLLIYARYHGCDPYTSWKINAHDQVLPFYILDVTSHIPGLPGVFIAGIFSASLSSLSAIMNSLSCTLYEDFIARHLTVEGKKKYEGTILKCIVIVVGTISTMLVFVVQHFKSILELSLSVASLSQGPMIGVFALGMFVPKANSKGALCGTVAALILNGWFVCNSMYYKSNGFIVYPTKDLSVDQCEMEPNSTFRIADVHPSWEAPYIYRISHYYYCFIGAALVFIIGIPISYITWSQQDQILDSDLISPVMRWAMPKHEQRKPEYYSMEDANKMVSSPS